MKALVLSFMSVLFIASTVEASEEPTTPCVQQIVNNDEEVFLLVDNSWYKAEGFQTIGSKEFALVDGEWMPLHEALEYELEASWKCSKCRRYNMDAVNTCPYCGKKRDR